MPPDLAVFPELAITGYPPRDLLLRSGFVSANLAVLERLAILTGETGMIVGFVGHNDANTGREFTNAVALLHRGKILATRTKTLLPTYDVFDEDRYFESASENAPVKFNDVSLELTVCEDIWNENGFVLNRRYRNDPVNILVAQGAQVIINVSASPWHLGKNKLREDMIGQIAKRSKCPIVYCNLVGGNDELVFDGASLVFDRQGQTIARGKIFNEDFFVVDFNQSTVATQYNFTDEEKIFNALVLGLRDYAHKSELAVGYCTLYGDMCGGLAVISDVPKTMVYRLSKWVNRKHEIIPDATITKPPSAELRPDQVDQDSLPPYDMLDAILNAYVMQERQLDEIVQAGFDSAIVRRILRLIDNSEYKRRQAAPGLKVTTKAFGMGRRIPIAQNYREDLIPPNSIKGRLDDLKTSKAV